MSKARVFVERVPEYYEQLAVDLGRLMPHLSDGRSDDPLPEHMIRPAIESDNHAILVAKSLEDGSIVGAANLSLTIPYELPRPEFWLGGFVVSQRRQGIGSELWKGILGECRARKANLGWTSNAKRTDRQDAIQFYTAQGAEVRDTTVFHLQVD